MCVKNLSLEKEFQGRVRILVYFDDIHTIDGNSTINEYCSTKKFTTIKLETNRETIAGLAVSRQDENDAFRIFVKNKDSSEIDKLVFSINTDVEKQIDCTECGACCKNLMINVTQEEALSVSKHLELNEVEFKKKYIEEGHSGQMIMNTIPCHFLENNKCSIYENRFSECRDFPHLSRPNFSDRLFGTFIHYSICPIIFNVVEQLKTALKFNID